MSDSAVSYYEEVSNSFKVLLEEDEKIHPSEDIETFLDFYGPPSRTSSFLSKQSECYSDRQLTLNFEISVEIFLCADMFPYEDFNILSV